MARPIYLDHHATTPCAPAVLQAMLPWFSEHFGNAHSGHAYGWVAEEACEQAREQVAALIGATPRELTFTSGATEANHLAICGTLEARSARGRHVITTVVEHASVLETLRHLAATGKAEVTWLPVDADGRVSPAELARHLRSDTVLVSVMHANNEIGAVQPLAELGALCRAHGAWLHTDAAQSVGKVPVDVDALNVDLLSLTAHKLYGPKGVGALYARRRNPRVALVPQQRGGGHERGLRSGTLPVPLVVGLGAAAALGQRDLAEESARLADLRDRLWAELRAALPELVLNGGTVHRLPHNLNFSVPGLPGDALITALRGLAISSGSACSTGKSAPSHVLRALGLPDALAHASLRFGLGRATTAAEVDVAVAQVVAAVGRLRAEAPGAGFAALASETRSVESNTVHAGQGPTSLEAARASEADPARELP
jgi:cysteine desulfurase